MEIAPPPRIAAIVRNLLPPDDREHVLGDLHERLQAHARLNPTRAYLRDVMRTVPQVIWSQIRRLVGQRLFGVQMVLLYGSFAAAALLGPGRQGLGFFSDAHGLRRISVPSLVTLAVLLLIDTYSLPKHRLPEHQFKWVAVALGAAFVANVALTAGLQVWALPRPLMVVGAAWSLCFVLTARALLPNGRQRHQAVQPSPRSAAELRTRAQGLEQEMRRRSLFGYFICLTTMGAFGWIAAHSLNDLQRIGAGLVVVGGLWLAHQVYRSRVGILPSDTGFEASLRFYRTELVRQRDFHSGPRLWSSMAALLPGLILWGIGFVLARPNSLPTMIGTGTVLVVLTIAAVPLNLRVARRYQRQLDELNAPERPQ